MSLMNEQPFRPKKSSKTAHQPHSKDLNSSNSFLALPGTVLANRRGKTLTFHIPLGYSHFECVVVTRSHLISKKYDYPTEEVRVKDLRHWGMEQNPKGRGWTLSR
jgi:hypothetical protein